MEVGRVVRIPLGGRRVDGFVWEREPEPSGRTLLPIAGVVSDLPVFTPQLAQLWEWVSQHYVAPLSVALKRSLPPLRVQLPEQAAAPPERTTAVSSPPVWPDRIWSKGEILTRVWLENIIGFDWCSSLLEPVVKAQHSAMVIAPTGTEVGRVVTEVRRRLPGFPVLMVTPEMSNRSVTLTWIAVNTNPHILVGTPKVSGWPICRLGALLVIEDGRRALKDRPTPTVSVRELLEKRSELEEVPLFVVGPTPTTEAFSRSDQKLIGPTNGTRLWPPVQIVDRSGQREFLGWDVSRKVQTTVENNQQILLFSHRRGYAPGYRCRACGALRRCPRCGTAGTQPDRCVRCGQGFPPCSQCGKNRFDPLGMATERVAEQARRIVDPEQVSILPQTGPVMVGSEADLLQLPPIQLAVIVEADRLIFGPHYRAAEDALRIFARVAGSVTPGPNSVTIVQTSYPSHPVLQALKDADPIPFLRQQLSERKEFDYPPFGELIVLEIRGSDRENDITATLSELTDQALVMGPATAKSGSRWLVQGKQLDEFRVGLRPWVQKWREEGATVRVDVDPIDL